MKIDGRLIATHILEDLKVKTESLKKQGVIPHLYIITLTDDSSSKSYINQKKIKGEEIGIKITIDTENPNIQTEKLIEKINLLNNDPFVHGIIVQRPMPSTIDEEKIKNAVIPSKDIDGFNPNSNFITPVAAAVLIILQKIHLDNFTNESFDNWLKKQQIAVLGKGITAGKPIIKMFNKQGFIPKIIDSKTDNKTEILKSSDIVISAVGKANSITSEMLKKDVILIGVGMHKTVNGKFEGDFNEEQIQNIASFHTPTPGGIGPVNVAMLLRNLVEASEN